MEENEYIPKSSSKPASKTEEPTRARVKKQEEAVPGRQKDSKKSSNEGPSAAAKLKERINFPKIKIIVGALLSL